MPNRHAGIILHQPRTLIVPSGGTALVNYDGVTSQLGIGVDLTNGTFIIKHTNGHLAIFTAYFKANADHIECYIVLNGEKTPFKASGWGLLDVENSVIAVALFQLNAGDIVSVLIDCPTDENRNIVVTNAQFSIMAV